MTHSSKASHVLAALAFLIPVAAYLGEWICGFCASDASIFRYIGKCVAEGAFFDLWDATLLFGLFEYCKTDQSWLSWWIGYFLGPPRFLWIIFHAAALVVLAFCGAWALARRGKGPLALFFATWVTIDLVMTFGFKTFYEHYLVVLYPACCILTGILLDDLCVRGKRISSDAIAAFVNVSFAVFAAYDCAGIRFARQQNRWLSVLCARLSEILPKGSQVALGGGHGTSELACRLNVRCPRRHFNAQMNHRFAGDRRRAEIIRELRATLDDPRTTHLLVEDREGFSEWTGFADVLNRPYVEMDGMTVVLLKRETVR